MGATTSTPVTSPEQDDLQFLADRFPFGDGELHRLYEAYRAISDSPANSRSTFLQDWAVQATLQRHRQGWKKRQLAASAAQDDQEAKEQREAQGEERRMLLQVAEEKILMPKTGDSLYQACCLAAGDQPLYPTIRNEEGSNPGASEEDTAAPPPPVDEYTRRARLEQMFTGFTHMGRKGAKVATQVMFDVIAARDESSLQIEKEPIRIHAMALARFAYALALATSFLEAAAADDDQGMADFTRHDPQSEQVLQAMASSMIAKGESRLQRHHVLQTGTHINKEVLQEALKQGFIEWDDLWEWTEDVGPLMASILPSFVQTLLFPDQPAPPSRTAYKFPRLSHPSIFFETPSSSVLFKLGCLTASLSGTYFRLYTSASDGLSFNRLTNALLGYGGPTLIVIRSTDGAVFGAFTGAAWKESKDFYGTSDSFLYQLSPVTAVYRPKSSGQPNYMYCNSYARSKGYDQQAHGIGFGGSIFQPRLFLAETFDYNDNYAGSQDVAYENGPFLPKTESGTYPKHFEVESLEVWGVGGDEVVQQALGAQSKARSIRDEGIRRAKKVDRAAFLDDLRSGVVDNKLFQHRQQVDGRADQDLEDRIKTKYDYEN